MSDISSIPTTLSNSSLFTENELIKCSVFNLKMFLFVLFIIICMSFLFSSLNSFFSDRSDSDGDDIYLKHRCSEHFSNDEMYSYKDAINPSYSNYQSTPLTSSSNDLIFGQANRYIYPETTSGKNHYRLEIYASLYVLNGNPFGSEKLEIKDHPHKYIANLKSTKTGKKLSIGQIKKDGDGVYKLKLDTDELQKYIEYNEVEVVYHSEEKETVLLNGKFTLL